MTDIFFSLLTTVFIDHLQSYNLTNCKISCANICAPVLWLLEKRKCQGKGKDKWSFHCVRIFAQMKCFGAEPEGLFNVWIALLYDKSCSHNCQQAIKLWRGINLMLNIVRANYHLYLEHNFFLHQSYFIIKKIFVVYSHHFVQIYINI